jgi:dTDP-4-amino-4,6-dideoxygalactose transaminase
MLPAFICPELSAMARHAGFGIQHVDVDRDTLHMNLDALTGILDQLPARDAVVLVDHAFGYVDPRIGQLRRRYPDVLIIEDCVRALGAVAHGRPVGEVGDWVLLSMYKVTEANQHGAILLTRSPTAAVPGPPTRSTVRERAAGFAMLRSLHAVAKRFGPSVGTPADGSAPMWAPLVGQPSALAVRRFERQIERLDVERQHRQAAADEIRGALAGLEAIKFIERAPGCQPAEFYLSFTVQADGERDRLVQRLQRRGLFLAWAWNQTPASYRVFQGTFSRGVEQTRYLAGHVCHIPLQDFRGARSRHRLIKALRHELHG